MFEMNMDAIEIDKGLKDIVFEVGILRLESEIEV